MSDLLRIAAELDRLASLLDGATGTRRQLGALVEASTARAMKLVIEAGAKGFDIGGSNVPGNVNAPFLPDLAKTHANSARRSARYWCDLWNATLADPTDVEVTPLLRGGAVSVDLVTALPSDHRLLVLDRAREFRYLAAAMRGTVEAIDTASDRQAQDGRIQAYLVAHAAEARRYIELAVQGKGREAGTLRRRLFSCAALARAGGCGQGYVKPSNRRCPVTAEFFDAFDDGRLPRWMESVEMRSTTTAQDLDAAFGNNDEEEGER